MFRSNPVDPARHHQASPEYDPQDDNARLLSVKGKDIVHICRSSFDRNYRGYNTVAANNPKKGQAWQQLCSCLDRGKHIRNASRVPAHLVQELLEAIDNYFFRGLLLRDRIVDIKLVSLGPRARGLTQTFGRNGTKQLLQTKGVGITINNDAFKDPFRDYGQFADLAGTIMHEACHAIFAIYKCNCYDCVRTYERDLGPSGHGTLWTELATAVVQRARKSRRLKNCGGDHVRVHNIMHQNRAGGNIRPASFDQVFRGLAELFGGRGPFGRPGFAYLNAERALENGIHGNSEVFWQSDLGILDLANYSCGFRG
ncbi:MAG: hypothetical protein M1814_000819 [Vezdaea aestivalis]|nr:MAG: hypothetical protein M1814_000819 [Vezdaea aestivalis]